LWVRDPLDFNSERWEDELRAKVRTANDPHGPHAIDYFLSPKDLLVAMPPFLIGRPGWDQWFIENALQKKVPVIDVTESVIAVHQAHHHNHAGGLEVYRSGPETQHNHALMGAEGYRYTMNYATHRLTLRGIERSTIRRLKAGTKHFFWYWLICRTGPLRRRLGLRRVARNPATGQ
jgi:hypothetical protein